MQFVGLVPALVALAMTGPAAVAVAWTSPLRRLRSGDAAVRAIAEPAGVAG